MNVRHKPPVVFRRLSPNHLHTFLTMLLVGLIVGCVSSINDASATEVWSTPVKVPLFGDYCRNLASPTLTATGDTMIFDWGSFYVTTLHNGVWSQPTIFEPLRDSQLCRSPSLSRDGRRLYFTHFTSTWFLYMCVRDTSTDGWSAPIYMGDTVNSPFAINYYCYQPDDTHLFVERDSDGSGLVELSLWDSAAHAWGPMREITLNPQTRMLCEPNTGLGTFGGFAITADMKRFYFSEYSSSAPDKDSDWQLFVTTWDSVKKQYCNPEALNIDTVFTSSGKWGIDKYPWISPDGRTLYYASNRDSTCNGFLSFWKSELISDAVHEERFGASPAGPWLDQSVMVPVSVGATGNSLTMSVVLHHAGRIRICASNLLGAVIGYCETPSLSPGSHIVEVPTGRLSAGPYFLRAQSGSEAWFGLGTVHH